jgi:hypothetical protein
MVNTLDTDSTKCWPGQQDLSVIASGDENLFCNCSTFLTKPNLLEPYNPWDLPKGVENMSTMKPTHKLLEQLKNEL